MTAEDLLEDDWLDLLESHLLVPHYLIACYLYYECDEPLLPDRTFDQLAARLRNEWSDVRHPHKKLIDPAALASGGSYLVGKFPLRVKQAAAHLVGRPLFSR